MSCTAATTGVSLDHALSAALVGVLPRLAGMQAPPPPPPPTDALSMMDEKTVELIVMGMNAADDARKEKLGKRCSMSLTCASRKYAMTTSGGDDEMA